MPAKPDTRKRIEWDAKLAVSRRDSGWTLDAIAAEQGCSVAVAQKKLRRGGPGAAKDKWAKRRDQIATLASAGKNNQEIARMLGVSWQRIQQIRKSGNVD